MEKYKLGDLFQQAKDLGATYYRHAFVERPTRMNYNKVEAIQTHFFNDDNTEVAYLLDSENLFELCGLYVFDKPRVWGMSFINHHLMGKPIDFDTICVKKLVNPLG